MTDNNSNNNPEEPVLEIPVGKAWVRLVRFCQVSFPYGTLTIKIVNSSPTILVDHHADIRFDKEPSIPTNFED